MQAVRLRRHLCLLALTALLLCQMAGMASAQAKATKWVELGVGAKQAKESGKPLFVVFRCVR